MMTEQEARDARKVAYAKAINAWVNRYCHDIEQWIADMVDDAFLAAVDEIERLPLPLPPLPEKPSVRDKCPKLVHIPNTFGMGPCGLMAGHSGDCRYMGRRSPADTHWHEGEHEE